VDRLVQEAVLVHQGLDIKFKRTKQQIDKTSFALRNSIDDQHKKIDLRPIRDYTNKLVGRSVTFKLFDLTSNDDDEQVTLVQCQSELGNS